ncbi:MAG: Nif11-like leader peptide family RiPP precursor [Arenicellales bacterium]|jgi:predicted ribosomally synthesized peptide with nif11-like leader|nr:Nif11-like leader peptide family RiPP precursor [Arenicellales bacterium]
MSKENLEQFMNQVAGSEELKAKFGDGIDTESLIALGAECGCEFTLEDLQEAAELSDEELDDVAGGFELGLYEGVYALIVGSSPDQYGLQYSRNKPLTTAGRKRNNDKSNSPVPPVDNVYPGVSDGSGE